MPEDINEILKNKAFQNLDKEKIEAIKDISVKIQGKSVPEAMSILNSYQNILTTGRPIAKEERELMIAVILNSMDDVSKSKFLSAMKMVNMMKGGN